MDNPVITTELVLNYKGTSSSSKEGLVQSLAKMIICLFIGTHVGLHRLSVHFCL